MTPDQLAKSGSEHAHQVALFAYCAVAAQHGFVIADTWAIHGNEAFKRSENRARYRMPESNPIPCLRWLHAIPNGGTRGDDAKSRAVRGGMLKAEGVRTGVADVFLPMPVSHDGILFAGLYIEMKKPDLKPKPGSKSKGGLSDEQIDFAEYVKAVGYKWFVCYTWAEAATVIKNYLEG